MNRRDVANYIKQVNRCLLKVDKAISKDIHLTKEEWFDYLFKGAFIGCRTENIKKYRVFHKGVVLMAEGYAEALSYLLDIAISGFKNSEYISYIKHIVHKMNRLIKRPNRLRTEGYDRDGYLFIRIYKGNERVMTITVANKEEAIEQILIIVGYCIENVDTITLGVEFTKFLKSYLQLEFNKITSCMNITPYMGGGTRCTLSDYLSDSYEGMTTGGKVLFTY